MNLIVDGFVLLVVKRITAEVFGRYRILHQIEHEREIDRNLNPVERKYFIDFFLRVFEIF